jgi:hypothetical protein
METKLFATSAEDAAAFASNVYRYGSEPFTIIEVEIPQHVAVRLVHMTIDRRPAVAVDRDMLAEFNSSVTIRILPSTPPGRR